MNRRINQMRIVRMRIITNFHFYYSNFGLYGVHCGVVMKLLVFGTRVPNVFQAFATLEKRKIFLIEMLVNPTAGARIPSPCSLPENFLLNYYIFLSQGFCGIQDATNRQRPVSKNLGYSLMRKFVSFDISPLTSPSPPHIQFDIRYFLQTVESDFSKCPHKSIPTQKKHHE